jgi:hypothetical protein
MKPPEMMSVGARCPGLVIKDAGMEGWKLFESNIHAHVLRVAIGAVLVWYLI